MADVNPHLSDNLRRLMGMHRVEQAELAGAVGMTKQGIWQIAAGRNMPRWSTIEKLAGAFGVEVGELLGSPEQAVLAGAEAFPTAPIRGISPAEIAAVNATAPASWDDQADVIKLRPPEGLTREEEADWYRAQGAKAPRTKRTKAADPDTPTG